MAMKAVSIQQPWVHAILTEGKDIENRKWTTKHRGWLALHASATPRPGADFPGRISVPDLKGLHYSAICGVARLTNVVTRSQSRWFDRYNDGTVNYGWALGRVARLKKPIRCKGALKLWDVPLRALREIRRQLPRIFCIKSPRQLRRAIAELSPASPFTNRFSKRWQKVSRKAGAQAEQKKVWYHNQQEHWLGWLKEYDGPGCYDRKTLKRSAEFVYNHIVNPQMLIYLAEASRVNRALLLQAEKAALAEAKNGASMSAVSGAIRRVMPWHIVEEDLVVKIMAKGWHQ